MSGDTRSAFITSWCNASRPSWTKVAASSRQVQNSAAHQRNCLHPSSCTELGSWVRRAGDRLQGGGNEQPQRAAGDGDPQRRQPESHMGPRGKPRRPGLAEPCGELAARQHIDQLGLQHLARAKPRLPGLGAIDQPARQPGGDQARDGQIGVGNKVQGLAPTVRPVWRAAPAAPPASPPRPRPRGRAAGPGHRAWPSPG